MTTTLQKTLSSAHRALVSGRALDADHLLKIAQQQAVEVDDELEQLRRELGRAERTDELPAFLQRQAD